MKHACVDAAGMVLWTTELPPSLDPQTLFQLPDGQSLAPAPDDVSDKRLQDGEWVALPASMADPVIALRAERGRLLAASDWTQLPDAPLTEDQRRAWADYRQALRDLPETASDLAAPIWPPQPT